MIGLKNRGSLPAITEDEFEHLVAQFRGLFLAEHNEDGTHITRDRELDFVPVGALQGWLTGTPPTGWVLLDGSQKNRLTYQGLFNLWGTTYGAGDGSTTFNLPDMRGRFFLGKAASGTGSVLGGTGGAIDHTHSGGALSGTTGATAPSISGSTGSTAPSISGNTASESSHTHSGDTDANTTTITVGTAGDQISVPTLAHDHDFTTDGGSAHSHGAGSLAVASHSHSTGTLAVASHTHDGGTLTMAATGANNPPFLVGNWIAFAGVA